MKTKILIASTLITSGLLAGCDLVSSTDPVKPSSNTQDIGHTTDWFEDTTYDLPIVIPIEE